MRLRLICGTLILVATLTVLGGTGGAASCSDYGLERCELHGTVTDDVSISVPDGVAAYYRRTSHGRR